MMYLPSALIIANTLQPSSRKSYGNECVIITKMMYLPSALIIANTLQPSSRKSYGNERVIITKMMYLPSALPLANTLQPSTEEPREKAEHARRLASAPAESKNKNGVLAPPPRQAKGPVHPPGQPAGEKKMASRREPELGRHCNEDKRGEGGYKRRGVNEV